LHQHLIGWVATEFGDGIGFDKQWALMVKASTDLDMQSLGRCHVHMVIPLYSSNSIIDLKIYKLIN
jgi:hypothetical protein